MPRKISFGCRVALAAIILCATALCQPVKSLPKPTDYVSDFAHVMSPAVIQKIDRVCGQVDHEANAQIAVVTVTTTADEPIEEYVVDLYQAWGLGKKGIKEGSDRGVLILVAVNDRKRFISTGYGLESILPDATVSVIGRQMVPYLRNNDFDGAMMLAVGQISQIIAKDAGVTLTPLTAQQRQQAGKPVHLGLGHLLLLGLLLLFVLFFLARFGGSGLIGFLLGMFMGGGFGGGGGGGFGDGGGRGRDDDGGSGFGGFGGGSTGGGGAGGDW
ncbi:MAG: TPM domain-containing protein [Silvibacterium sp.]|nr:TPM domain-containing protein [Silvibacterium sp.]MBV8438521.1 TPM domain-containing protein [Silvibacterium sp.]